jgi:hypothetical protein
MSTVTPEFWAKDAYNHINYLSEEEAVDFLKEVCLKKREVEKQLDSLRVALNLRDNTLVYNDEYAELKKRDAILRHLEQLGVDNWEGYQLPEDLV